MFDTEMGLSAFENGYLFDGDKFAGVTLGYTLGTDHDWGFAGVLRALQVGLYEGVGRYKAGPRPSSLRFFRHEGCSSLSLLPSHDDNSAAEFIETWKGDVPLVESEPTTFWDMDSFIILAKGQAEKNLQLLYKAFCEGEAGMGLPRGTAHGVRYPVFVLSEYIGLNRDLERGLYH